MTRFFPQRGIAFPLLIPEESGEVVERPRMREGGRPGSLPAGLASAEGP